jgi:hypothetical protein
MNITEKTLSIKLDFDDISLVKPTDTLKIGLKKLLQFQNLKDDSVYIDLSSIAVKKTAKGAS